MNASAFFRSVWQRGKLGGAEVILGVLFLLAALLIAVGNSFHIGDTQVTASTFNSFCSNPGFNFGAQPGSCAQAATDVRGMWNAVFLGVILLIDGPLWIRQCLYKPYTQLRNAWVWNCGGWAVFWLLSGIFTPPHTGLIGVPLSLACIALPVGKRDGNAAASPQEPNRPGYGRPAGDPMSGPAQRPQPEQQNGYHPASGEPDTTRAQPPFVPPQQQAGMPPMPGPGSAERPQTVSGSAQGPIQDDN